MSDLTGKVAMITGASRGQGEAEARLFVERGAKVIVADVLDDQAKTVATELGENHALAVHLDVSRQHDWEAALAAGIDRFGHVDVLVNNAGIFHQGTIDQTDLDLYRKLIEVNQIGVYLGMRTLSPHMKQRGGGSIVNIVSVSAFAPLDHTAAYASTKSALLAMSKAAVGELGPYGIRVNMIHPGGVATEMGAPQGVIPNEYSSTPLGRIGQPREIATVVAFLASEDSSYCSGAEILVDGGWTVGTRNPWRASD